MRGAVLYAPGDVRFEERDAPKIIEPTDAVIRMSATCVCGSDLWRYRGIAEVPRPTPIGHEYVGVVEEVGAEVTSVQPGQFVVGGFLTSDNTCPLCKAGAHANCQHGTGYDGCQLGLRFPEGGQDRQDVLPVANDLAITSLADAPLAVLLVGRRGGGEFAHP